MLRNSVNASWPCEGICQRVGAYITMPPMKRLLTVAVAALLSLSASVRAEGPDDNYIEIYKVIQEGDQFAASGRPEFARQKYSAARAELKKLQASYPNWNS